ncbi:MAG: DUF1501 domain-containing protein [Oceanospirillaceae bacterium]|nr:DUF1501 domain-containing protein [Oceanospirillaceae bacterium]
MKRRDFLKGLAGTSLLFSGVSSKQILANNEDNYDGPLFIHMFAKGGWDASLFCDPKPFERNDWEGEGIRSTQNLIYAPVWRETQAGRDYFNDYFFNKYYEYTRVINGIFINSNAHSPSLRYAINGVLDNSAYPSIMAAFAASQAPDLPMSYIAASELKFTGQLIPYTPLSNPNLLSSLANPFINNDRQFLPENIINMVKEAQLERLIRLQQLESKLPGQDRRLVEYINAKQSSNLLDRLASLIPQDGFEDVDVNGNPNRLIPTIHSGLLSMKSGLTCTLGIEQDGYDTHGDNSAQFDLLGELLYAIDFCWEEAKRLGIDDRLAVVVTSEFCRTPGLQGSRGTDHWPYGQLIAMTRPTGGFYRPIGNRRIGESNDLLQSKKLNFTDLSVSDGGEKLQPEHLHIALREFLGIAGSERISNFPLVGQSLPLFD